MTDRRERTCCDGECNQGRDCPMSARRRRVDPVNAATWAVVIAVGVAVISFIVIAAMEGLS